MIEDYINAARRTKPPTEALVAQYRDHYSRVRDQVSPIGGHPDLFIVYSSERRCELVHLGGKLHLVYDQYLGQSFNRLNRIQFAKHRPDLLSMSYACKFVAERLATLDAIGPATLFGLLSGQFELNAHEEGDPFDGLGEDEKLRHQLISAQEMFVMAHEMAHHRWTLEGASLGLEMSGYIDDFLRSRDDAQASAESPKASVDYYRTILSTAGPDFREEVFADDFGGLIAMRAALTLGVRPWQASLGVVLAFKYLRLFRHLEILSHKVASLTASGQGTDLQTGLLALKDEIWDSAAGTIGRFQFREHFLRHRLSTDRKKLPDYDVRNESRIAAVVGDYDEKTEFPAVLGLVDRLTSSPISSLLTEIERSMTSKEGSLRIVDQLTGWQK